MRTIKFRAWDGKAMVYLNSKWWCNEYTSLAFGAKELHAICGFSHIDWDYDREPEPELMQFTGLLDAKGKEIYEGDVVCIYAIHSNCKDLPKTAQYPNGEPFTENTYHSQIVWDTERAWWDGLGRDADGMFDEVELIGNIYENPELLNT